MLCRQSKDAIRPKPRTAFTLFLARRPAASAAAGAFLTFPPGPGSVYTHIAHHKQVAPRGGAAMQVSLGRVRQAVSLVGSLADLEHPDGFAELVLPGAAAQVRYADYPAGALDPATQMIFEAHVHEHPLISHYRATGSGEAVKISDFLSQRQFHQLGLYAEFYRRIPVEHQIAISMLGSDGAVIGIALNRGRADFTETDRAVLSLLRAPLMAALLRARNRQRANSALSTTAPASLAALTDREMRVLELVALGGTNAAIAHALGVSPRTIAKHLEHIYRKLGVTSRAAAAAQSAAQPQGSRWNAPGR